MSNLSIVILAAGYGTRMRSKTPKVLHTISGKAMLSHTIATAQKLSDDVKVVLYFEHEMIKQQMQQEFEDVEYIIQDVQNFPGTGGALRNIKYKNKEVLILNGDMPLITPQALQPLIAAQTPLSMSVIKAHDPDGYGRVVIENAKVQRIIEQKDCTPSQLTIKDVNAGVYKIDSALLERYIPRLSNENASGEYYLTDIIEFAVKEDVAITPAYVCQEFFKGVNSKYDLAGAEVIMQDRIKKQWMQKGVVMRLPDTIYIDAQVSLCGECILENGVTLLGTTTLEDAHIKAHSVVEGATITSSSVGPMARIRPRTTLIDSHVGNFVEVKKSTLNGVKAGHLSYLGDCEVGQNSNIGAGVITCNYDGKAKYKTRIGKNVFIGSDCQLVAPVTLEDDTIVAAGTTVNKDIAQGELAISRTPLKKIKDFYYKFFAKSK
ncbi:MAG: bifunctional UDP-N-acetylglucosamine diphosphorylase/glucosamine-1-phosphate N-acetyltransferase GlmU [Campylobacterota bacterium]